MSQAQSDIRRKLQKLEGFAGKNISELIEVATKVFINRDQEAKRESDRKLKRKADLLAAALTEQISGPGRGRGKNRNSGPPLLRGPRTDVAPDQCRYCKSFGHWLENCPPQGQT